MPRAIAFRVDGNSRMGTGHLARCRALADACVRRGWNVFWITSFADGWQFAPAGKKVKALSVPRGLPERRHALAIRKPLQPGDAVVLDGYHFSRGLEMELRRLGLKVATIDDNARRFFAAHWILNGNVHARQLRYRRAKGTKVALGPRYFIFSEEIPDSNSKIIRA